MRTKLRNAELVRAGYCMEIVEAELDTSLEAFAPLAKRQENQGGRSIRRSCMPLSHVSSLDRSPHDSLLATLARVKDQPAELRFMLGCMLARSRTTRPYASDLEVYTSGESRREWRTWHGPRN